MPLPKYLTTVTPLSKYLAMALFIIFPFVGFYLGTSFQKQMQLANVPVLTPSPKPTVSPIQQIPNFLDQYIFYENTTLGVSFYYPYQWKVEKTNDNGGNPIIEIYNPDSISTQAHLYSSDKEDYMITIRQDTQFTDIFHVMAAFASVDINGIGSRTINNHMAYRRFFTNEQETYIDNLLTTNNQKNKTIDPKKEKVILITRGDKTVTSNDIYEHLLSTFKFTDQTLMVGNFIWNVPANALSASIANEIKNAFAVYNIPKNSQNDTTHLSVDTVVISSESADFALAKLSVRDNENKIVPTDGIQYYLQKQNSTWEIITGSNTNFCQKVKIFPKDLIDETSYYNYYGCPT